MKNKLSEITLAEFHEKGWGYELWLTNNEKYCGKILHFNPNKRCSLHYHKLKHEHFYVLKGLFKVSLADTTDEVYSLKCKELLLLTGSVLEIPPLKIHQMISLCESEIVEISTQHFEKDSYRIIKGD